MKNFIHAFLLLTALALAGCETDETRAVIPDLSVTAIETGTESFMFSVEETRPKPEHTSANLQQKKLPHLPQYSKTDRHCRCKAGNRK